MFGIFMFVVYMFLYVSVMFVSFQRNGKLWFLGWQRLPEKWIKNKLFANILEDSFPGGRISVSQHRFDIILFVMYCYVMYCTVMYCYVMYCSVMYCSVMYCSVMYCSVMYCDFSDDTMRVGKEYRIAIRQHSR